MLNNHDEFGMIFPELELTDDAKVNNKGFM